MGGRDTEGGHHVKTKAGMGMPRVASSCQELGDRGEAGPPSERPEGTKLTNNLTSDFQPPELWDSELLLCEVTQFVVPGYGSPRKRIQGSLSACWYSPVFFPTSVGTGPWAQGQPGL